ncbi:TBC1 domain family member 20 [Aphelenchoides besseyi]|nr:TBC1 domain family member 20 [Aphelenchoides besseyi]KAI6220497.1 TBC1 domain family member 20 [Aphelenchoides besseyi]
MPSYSSEDIQMLNSVDLRKTPVDYFASAKERRLETKAKKIAEMIDSGSRSSEALLRYQKYAKSGGLLRDDYRREIWPLLAANLPPADHLDATSKSTWTSNLSIPTRLHSNCGSESEIYDSARSSLSTDDVDTSCDLPSSSPSLEELQKHVEWNQVELDVHRTLARFPPNIDETERLQLQADLTPMIVELLSLNANFRYYQGFHDVCLTLMLAMDVERAKQVGRLLVERGTFRNYLTKSLEESALRELQFLYVILWKSDPELERHMRNAELGTLFALSWPLTWFSHALDSYEHICRCFDLFLASHPLMPIYVSAALVEHRRGELMSAECDMPILHHMLNHVPKSVDLDYVLARAQSLFNDYRPQLIQGKFLRDYEQLCEREGKLQRIPPANTIQRTNLPLAAAGVAILSVGVYWILSKYQMEFNLN